VARGLRSPGGPGPT